MSLPTDAPPPGHLPPAATPPWPVQPPPHGAHSGDIPVKPREKAGAIGAFGAALIGGAVAAIGLAVAIPLLRREWAAKPKGKPARRKKAK